MFFHSLYLDNYHKHSLISSIFGINLTETGGSLAVCFLKRTVHAKYLWQRSVLNRYCGILNNPMKPWMLNHNLDSQLYFSDVFFWTQLQVQKQISSTFPILFFKVSLILKKKIFALQLFPPVLLLFLSFTCSFKVKLEDQ